MRRSLLLTSLLAATLAGTAAQAADLAAKTVTKAPVAAPAFSWTGFYIGAQAGYGWAKNDFSNSRDPLNPTTISAVDAEYSLDGALVGGQIGYNYQINSIVIGVEADAAWADISGSGAYFNGVANSCIQSNDACHSKIDALGTITGRLGVAFDRVLVYGKGGAAWASVSHSAGNTDLLAPAFNYAADANSTRWGWTVGAGVEYAVTNNWSAKIEYNYVDLGSNEARFNFAPATFINPYVATVDQSLQLLKVGINYRF
ncbi:outer membrane protein [Xanthobacter sp. V4C-4]|uniref:outer membrane protein n=1 Tax=Xanthobacter cornucopiae TaxID=3119924 RepID=UPI0037264214